VKLCQVFVFAHGKTEMPRTAKGQDQIRSHICLCLLHCPCNYLASENHGSNGHLRLGNCQCVNGHKAGECSKSTLLSLSLSLSLSSQAWSGLHGSYWASKMPLGKLHKSPRGVSGHDGSPGCLTQPCRRVPGEQTPLQL
jgi:hypothetical protein